MKISEALRIGAAKRPQVQGWLFAWYTENDQLVCEGTCALGAIYEATCQDTSEKAIKDLDEKFWRENGQKEIFGCVNQSLDKSLYTLVEHPTNTINMPVWEAIMNLNDHERWTREQIAVWLESIGL